MSKLSVEGALLEAEEGVKICAVGLKRKGEPLPAVLGDLAVGRSSP